MMRILFIFVYTLLAAVTTFAQPTKHVILISIDGLRPEMYLDKTWPALHLQFLMKQGTYARHMKSVFPAYTYPSHTAMLTGALPARSGIVHNVKNDKGDWYWFTSDIRVPTLWQAIKKAGMTTSAVQWPVSVDSTITYNVPEIWDNKHPEDRISETRKYATSGLIEEIEQNATGKLDSNNMRDGYFTLDENAGRMAAYIFKTHKPNLLCVHFAEVDGMEHEFGREADSVRMAVATADKAIGHILESVERSGMKKSTTIIIVGDHGFCDISEVLKPNVILRQSQNSNIRGKFVAAGGSCFYYGTDGEQAKAVLDTCPYKKHFKIYSREKLDKLGADNNASFALAAVPGIVFSNSTEGEQLKKVKGGHHGYDPDMPEMYTGFIAAGAGISKGKIIDRLCVTDIAPLIAKLLGIEFNTPDGKLVEGILVK